MILNADGSEYRKPDPAPPPPGKQRCLCGKKLLDGYNGMCWQDSVTDNKSGVCHTRGGCNAK